MGAPPPCGCLRGQRTGRRRAACPTPPPERFVVRRREEKEKGKTFSAEKWEWRQRLTSATSRARSAGYDARVSTSQSWPGRLRVRGRPEAGRRASTFPCGPGVHRAAPIGRSALIPGAHVQAGPDRFPPFLLSSLHGSPAPDGAKCNDICAWCTRPLAAAMSHRVSAVTPAVPPARNPIARSRPDRSKGQLPSPSTGWRMNWTRCPRCRWCSRLRPDPALPRLQAAAPPGAGEHPLL